MNKPKVFLTRKILESGQKIVQDFCSADIWPNELPPSHEEILSHVSGKEGVLSLLTDKIDEEIIKAGGTSLKVISNCAAGVDNVDVATATARGIPVGNTPGVLTEATADFTFALMLAAARRLIEGEHMVRSGGWKTWSLDMLLGQDFNGAVLGVVGFGRIGQAVARRAAGFGMRIIYNDPNRASLGDHGNDTDKVPYIQADPVDLDVLLSESDIISLHTPLNDETRGLINAVAFAKMKKTVVLVNTSRGPVVDKKALYQALKSHRIFAAALDVTDPEPLPLDSRLLSLDNCIVTPHIASASQRTRQNMSKMAAENLIAGLKGDRLPYCANPEVYS